MSAIYYYLPFDTTMGVESIKNQLGWNMPSNPSDEFLNSQGFYRIDETTADSGYDGLFYEVETTFVINGVLAEYSHVATARPLAEVQELAVRNLKNRASSALKLLSGGGSFEYSSLLAIILQDPADRLPGATEVIAVLKGAADRLKSRIDSVNAAPDTATVETILLEPDMVFNTGRGLSGDSQEMNDSHFTTINLNGISESDIELTYEPEVPQTEGITLPYRTDLVAPAHFTMSGAPSFFATGEEVIVIRLAASKIVLGRVTIPDTGVGANVDVNVFVSESLDYYLDTGDLDFF